MIHFSPSARGFFHPAIHVDTMPADAVPITNEEHAALLDGQARGAEIVAGPDGRPCLHEPLADPVERLAHAKRAARQRLGDQIAQALRAFTRGVPPPEVASWPAKAEAARTMLKDRRGVSSLIAAEAEITGDDPKELAKRIVVKADAYEGIIARLTGVRRLTVAEIEAADCPEAVEAVVSNLLPDLTKLFTDPGQSVPPATKAASANEGA
jgi:hypothetical protein